jgi:hypothetical protein
MSSRLLEAALHLEIRQGRHAGRRLGDVFLLGAGGLPWLRWCSRTLVHPAFGERLDAARRGAARQLLELTEPTDRELADRDLEDELLCIAALNREMSA